MIGIYCKKKKVVDGNWYKRLCFLREFCARKLLLWFFFFIYFCRIAYSYYKFHDSQMFNEINHIPFLLLLILHSQKLKLSLKTFGILYIYTHRLIRLRHVKHHLLIKNAFFLLRRILQISHFVNKIFQYPSEILLVRFLCTY